MNPTTMDQPATWTEFTVPAGCVLCEGTVVIRLSERGAVSLCRGCRTVARPTLEYENGRVTLQQRFTADA